MLLERQIQVILAAVVLIASASASALTTAHAYLEFDSGATSITVAPGATVTVNLFLSVDSQRSLSLQAVSVDTGTSTAVAGSISAFPYPLAQVDLQPVINGNIVGSFASFSFVSPAATALIGQFEVIATTSTILTPGFFIAGDDTISEADVILFSGAEITVPEPTTGLLVGTGLIAVAMARRRTRRNHA